IGVPFFCVIGIEGPVRAVARGRSPWSFVQALSCIATPAAFSKTLTGAVVFLSIRASPAGPTFKALTPARTRDETERRRAGIAQDPAVRASAGRA
ncbi:MAG TPA: hypothetical protein VFC59_05330, partial [Cryobacterium sp.]|nr:hypothetical protein [Cryobacterium sp.]